MACKNRILRLIPKKGYVFDCGNKNCTFDGVLSFLNGILVEIFRLVAFIFLKVIV